MIKEDGPKKKHGPVWFTLNPSVKDHRETQKNEFSKNIKKFKKLRKGMV